MELKNSVERHHGDIISHLSAYHFTGLSVPNTSSGITMPGSSGGLGSDVYGVDSDAQFLDDCSPSTVAMMDTSSPVEVSNAFLKISWFIFCFV